jgi:hypothetical protein
MTNPKHETLNPKQIQMFKMQNKGLGKKVFIPWPAHVHLFGTFVLCFLYLFRISDLAFRICKLIFSSVQKTKTMNSEL